MVENHIKHIYGTRCAKPFIHLGNSLMGPVCTGLNIKRLLYLIFFSKFHLDL